MAIWIQILDSRALQEHPQKPKKTETKNSTHLQIRISSSFKRVHSLTTVFSIKFWHILVEKSSSSDQVLLIYGRFWVRLRESMRIAKWNPV